MCNLSNDSNPKAYSHCSQKSRRGSWLSALQRILHHSSTVMRRAQLRLGSRQVSGVRNGSFCRVEGQVPQLSSSRRTSAFPEMVRHNQPTVLPAVRTSYGYAASMKLASVTAACQLRYWMLCVPCLPPCKHEAVRVINGVCYASHARSFGHHQSRLSIMPVERVCSPQGQCNRCATLSPGETQATVIPGSCFESFVSSASSGSSSSCPT